MKRKLILAALGLSLVSSLAMAEDYTMRPGDQLSIVVVQEPAISTSVNSSGTMTPYVVRPDGKVMVPMVGEVDANGMTVDAFTNVLKQRLSRYIINHDVSVNVVKLGGVRVYVFGEVNKPGAYELTKGHRVIDAIGAASGFNWDTAKKKIYLIHQDRPKELIPINLNHILETGDMSQNYEMREGDVLYLTKNSRISFSRDIAPIFSSLYVVTETKKNIE